jgi:glycerol-3-phosphate dehydrogenase
MKRDLNKLASKVFDVLVIGGGIHGAATAWDAALRGLSVALIERGDFGSATSQNSLKIIHGGLRYFQDGNIPRIRTMARERTTWMRIAPHLVHPLACLMPTRKKISRSRLALGMALAANDVLSFDRNRLHDPEKRLPGGRIILSRDLSRMLPGYDTGTSTGAAVWHDAQIYNSERLLLEFIISASNEGAEVANYVEAIGLLVEGNRIIGTQARDGISGRVMEIHSKLVINCAGAWSDNLLGKISLSSHFGTSVAMNLTVDRIWPDIAAGLPSQPAKGKPSRILFIVPWRNKSLIGTWHIPWNGSPNEFQITEAAVQAFLDEINSAHPVLRLTLKEVQHVTWGFLPVSYENAGKKEVKLTRDGVVIDHQKEASIEGLISILGVKYTTARAVAEQAINLAVRKLGKDQPPCGTTTTPLWGGRIDSFETFLSGSLAEAPRWLDREISKHLVYSYGSNYSRLLRYIMEQPELAQRIDPYLPVTAAEVIHAVREEMAITLPDVVQRRTELGATGRPAPGSLQRCAELMAAELGWSLERQQDEIGAVIQAFPFSQLEMERA